MTLDDVVREGKEESLLRDIKGRFIDQRDQTFNPVRTYFDIANVDHSTGTFKIAYDDSEEWPSTYKADWVKQQYNIEADELVTAVVAIRDEAIGAITDPKLLYGIFMNHKPLSPVGLGTTHGVAYEAFELLQEKDPAKIEEKLNNYTTAEIARLNAIGADKHAVAAVEFAFRRNPNLVRGAVIGSAEAALAGFERTVTENLPNAHRYLGSLYDGLNDKEKKKLTLQIGQVVTALRTAPAPTPTAP